MAKTKELSFSMGATVTQGYNSRRIDCGEVVTVEDGDNIDVVRVDIRNRVVQRLLEELVKVTPK